LVRVHERREKKRAKDSSILSPLHEVHILVSFEIVEASCHSESKRETRDMHIVGGKINKENRVRAKDGQYILELLGR